MKAPITSAQAMHHPAVVETINVLSELCRELRAELETVRADERERIAKWYETEGHMMFPVAIPDVIRGKV
jgi:hypothetical protein